MRDPSTLYAEPMKRDRLLRHWRQLTPMVAWQLGVAAVFHDLAPTIAKSAESDGGYRRVKIDRERGTMTVAVGGASA